MLKMYHRHVEAGGSAAYWEDFGRHGTLADRVGFLDIDPLRPLFSRYLKPGARMLEGGCGRGQYVAYYTARGAQVVGLDFARGWLNSIHREAPWLQLCAGDVGALPFEDGSFDLYYSGGVVEHFEGGSERALAEARRVLKPDGILLISVPYYSPLRHALRFARRDDWRRVSRPRVEPVNGDNRRFYQYAYSVADFSRMLAAAGLRVLDTRGYAILWGLYDVDALRQMGSRLERGRPHGAAATTPAGAARLNAAEAGTNGRGARALLKRLLVAEDDTVPVAGWLVRLGRWAASNMMMYVCTPNEAFQA